MGLLHTILPLLVLGLAAGAPEEDLIVDLPGLDYPINFKQYSGYLNGDKKRQHLHYWLTESQNDPAKDPLVLWLNGGPGCSSLSGLLTENGPFRVNSHGSKLIENPFAWNLVANVLYLESPTCVGFSYNDFGLCKTGDREVADMNYEAIKNFFEKFPEYRDREFYVTGESYGGIYVPTLSVKIVEGNTDYPINFKGYAIGNGLLSYTSNYNSLMFFGHYHALLGDRLWHQLVRRCCRHGVESRDACWFFMNPNPICDFSVMKAEGILYTRGINMYNIYKPCESSKSEGENRYKYDLMNLRFNRTHDHPDLYMDPTCIDSTSERTYLNNPAVRKALHIPENVQDWDICSREVSLMYLRTVYNVESQIKTLRDHQIKGLIFNGDVDMACNFLGNEWFVHDLAFDVVEKRTIWKEGGQDAGFVTRYNFLDFLTIKGAGHMVPEDKPAEALHMFKSFIQDEPY